MDSSHPDAGRPIPTISEPAGKDYAFFLSLTDNYTYLFNAQLNSIELFGIGKYADVVVIHDQSITPEIVSFYQDKIAAMDVDVTFLPISRLPEDKDLGKAMTVKFYRYKMMAEFGQKYKSICFIDSDIYLCSDVKEYFDIAAKTDLIVATNDRVVRQYKSGGGSCPAWADGRKPFFEHGLWDGKFCCNVPMFIDVRKYGDVFLDIFAHRNKLGMDNTWPFNGDLETMNIVLNKHQVKNRMMILADHLWTGVHYSIYRISTMVKLHSIPQSCELSDPTYRREIMFMSETCEHVRSFHGRDWTSSHNENRIKNQNIPKLLGQMEGDFGGGTKTAAVNKRKDVYDTIQAYCLFLEFDCYVSIEELGEVVQIPQYEYLKEQHGKLEGKIKQFMPTV